MQALTRGYGLTRTELRQVNSEGELQSMLAQLQSVLERFTSGDFRACDVGDQPISLREQEAVLEGLERAVRGAATQAGSRSVGHPAEFGPGEFVGHSAEFGPGCLLVTRSTGRP